MNDSHIKNISNQSHQLANGVGKPGKGPLNELRSTRLCEINCSDNETAFPAATALHVLQLRQATQFSGKRANETISLKKQNLEIGQAPKFAWRQALECVVGQAKKCEN
jgi:hypothetical protein